MAGLRGSISKFFSYKRPVKESEKTFGSLRRTFCLAALAALLLFPVRSFLTSNPISSGTIVGAVVRARPWGGPAC